MYLVFALLNDWIPALVSLSYRSSEETQLALVSQRHGTISFLAFVLGLLLIHRRQVKVATGATTRPGSYTVSRKQLYSTGLAGLVVWLGVFPLVRGLPTATALASGGKAIVLASLFACYLFRPNFGGSVSGSTGLTAAFAIATVVFAASVLLLGFSGYGLMIFSLLAAVITRRTQRRLRMLVPACILCYLGMSIFQTYMRDRSVMRELLWEKGAALSVRAAQMRNTFENFEWFNPWDPQQRKVITSRLAQGWMFGRVVNNLQAGHVEYLWGQSIVEGFTALIPRILWPGKPVYVGNSEIVAKYTGLNFRETTSVGLGPSFEFYINFGIIGLFVGNFLLGSLTRHCDYQMAASVQKQNLTKFLCWSVLALSIVQTGRLAELMSSAGAAVAAAYCVARGASVFSGANGRAVAIGRFRRKTRFRLPKPADVVVAGWPAVGTESQCGK